MKLEQRFDLLLHLTICKFFPINDAVQCRLGAGGPANGAAQLQREASRQGDCCKSMMHVDNQQQDVCSYLWSICYNGFLKYVGIN
jgi:hypothetical protein